MGLPQGAPTCCVTITVVRYRKSGATIHAMLWEATVRGWVGEVADCAQVVR